MRHPLLVATTLSVLAGAATPAAAQFTPPTVFDGAPAAPWISSPDVPGDDLQVVDCVVCCGHGYDPRGRGARRDGFDHATVAGSIP